MKWREWIIVFLIMLIGMSSLIAVDRECFACTGKGGKVGLSINKTVEGDLHICFFGLEQEIPL